VLGKYQNQPFRTSMFWEKFYFAPQPDTGSRRLSARSGFTSATTVTFQGWRESA
jgi:hypothetical protein